MINWPSRKRVPKSILYFLFVPIMLLAALACTAAEAEMLKGILEKVDTANGEITIVTKDGKTVILTISTDAPVVTDGAISALETLEPGASVEVEVDQQIVRLIRAHQAKVEGTIVEIEGDEVTVESERGRKITVLVQDITRIYLEDDFPGLVTDLRAGSKVEIKFDPESRVAFKIGAEEEDAEIEGRVVGPVTKLQSKPSGVGS